MGTETILLIIVIAAGFYMAWSVGANDVANAMGTSVGSGALTVKRAVIVAAFLEFAGAFFVGTHVSETIRKGIINPDIFIGHELMLVYGMIGALLSAAIWLQIASYFGWPVSTTHSIVGAVLGFGVMYGGTQAADWGQVGFIVASWVISPLLSGIIAYLIFSTIRRLILRNEDPIKVTKKVTPYLVFLVFTVLTVAMVFKGLKNLNLDLNFGESVLMGMAVGVVAGIISHFLVKRVKEIPVVSKKESHHNSEVIKNRLGRAIHHLNKAESKSDGQLQRDIGNVVGGLEVISSSLDKSIDVHESSTEYKTVEKIFVYLQILSAAFVAFAHGANDVANAVGPMAAVVTVLQTGKFATQTPVPLWVLGLGGVGIVIGLATWGWRVMLTIGKKITELTPSRGFSAEFATAITIVFASKLGLPVSTTHTLVGGVLGVGFARGIDALNLRVISNIVISWVITIPVGAIGAITFFYLFRAIFG
jgi:PiT family inorganic phosphate transporter